MANPGEQIPVDSGATESAAEDTQAAENFRVSLFDAMLEADRAERLRLSEMTDDERRALIDSTRQVLDEAAAAGFSSLFVAGNHEWNGQEQRTQDEGANHILPMEKNQFDIPHIETRRRNETKYLPEILIGGLRANEEPGDDI